MISKTISALNDENRRLILDLLKQGELTVSDIGKHLNITLATLSHHLDILKKADLVSPRRDGKQIYYSLNLSVLDEVAKNIIKLLK